MLHKFASGASEKELTPTVDLSMGHMKMNTNTVYEQLLRIPAAIFYKFIKSKC